MHIKLAVRLRCDQLHALAKLLLAVSAKLPFPAALVRINHLALDRAVDPRQPAHLDILRVGVRL
nr:MAG TPA: hypothetical protein [Caudoviricetes sp.]